jgi:putative ABC transport system permease protein
MLQDLRFALRILTRNPGFAIVSILALALGSGANTAIFTAVDAILLRPLPYAQPDRLAAVWEDAAFIGFPRNTPAPANYFDWKSQNTVFEKMSASRFVRLAIRGDGAAPELVRARAVTPDMFDTLGVTPALGRTFTLEEDRQDAPVAVISHGLWIRRFGGEASVLNRTVEMNGKMYTIAGVMPRGFFFPDRQVDAYIPAGLEAKRAERGSHYLQVIGRLKPGVTVDQARADMKTIAKRLADQYPDTNAQIGAVVNPAQEDLIGDTRLALIVLLCAAGCVLLIACANLANLLLSRATGRSREIAVRLAVGANRRTLLLQLLTESLVLALLGGAAGIGLAALALSAIERMLPQAIAVPLSLDWRTLLFSLAISSLAGILFGLAPAWHSSRADLHSTLKQTGRTGASRGQGYLRDALVAGEFALAFILLTGAGLLMQTLFNLQSTELGFEPKRVLTASIALPPGKYANDERVRDFYREAIGKLQAMPGVEAAAFADMLPFQSIGNTRGFEIEGRPPERHADALYREVTPNYLPTMGAKLLAGRFHTDDDQADSQPVVIVNQTFQRLYWPANDALGKRVRYGRSFPWMTIVGVVADLRERGATLAMKPATYPSVNQAQRTSANNLVVRAAAGGDLAAANLAPAVRAAFASIDPGIVVARVMTMNDLIDATLVNRRYPMEILTVFAGLALLLAAIGVYGVLSYAVAQRTREIGLRMALGADAGSVTRMIAGRGLKLAGIGLAVGLVGAFFFLRLAQSALYGVTASDPKALAGSAAVLLAVTAFASYLPARRAARVDPILALRDE